ncbi:MAG: hypothetical protein EOM02_13710 [Synergistales bacterium]|nr:hypothetical protein [Synergistales bacterium]
MDRREFLIMGRLNKIDFAPASLVEEVVQNVRTILSTAVWTVPLDRRFGVDVSMLDKPTPEAMAALSAEIYGAIHKYEPRCKIKGIDFEGDVDGRLSPKVRVEIYGI